MLDVTCAMKVAQTEFSEAEYRLLAEYAKKKGLTLKQALRDGALRLIHEERLDPDDTLFTHAPLAKASGKKERTSLEHDKYLYGSSR